MGVEQVPTLANGAVKWVGDGDDRHLEVTFRIRRGLKWHDGQPVRAADMRFHHALMLNAKFRVDDRAAELRVHTVEPVDEQSAIYKYHSARQAREAAARGHVGLPRDEFREWREQKEPLVDPLYMLAAGYLPEHLLGKVDPAGFERHPFAQRPVLAGPYRVKELVGESWTLEAVADHPLGAPNVPALSFKVIREVEGQLAALAAGEVDVVSQVGGPEVKRAPELDRLAQAGQIKVHYVPGSSWEHLDFNLDNEHLKERNVRRAFAHGINREQIVDRVLFGKSKVSHSWVQPGLPAWSTDEGCPVKYPFDAARAKAMLAEAGYRSGPDGILARAGRKLQLRLATTDQPLRRYTAQAIQAQLKQLGVGVELEVVPLRGLFDVRGPLRSRNFDLALYAWASALDPDRLDYMHSRNIPSDRNAFAGHNFPGLRNVKVDELTIRGAASIDEAERKPIYCDLQWTWTEELPALPLFQHVSVTLARARLRNFKPGPATTVETWNVQQWELA